MQPFVSYLALLRWYRFRPRWSNYAGSFPDRDQHGSDRGDDDRPEDREHRPTTVTDRILEKSTPCSANQTELSEAQVFFRDKHSRRPGLVAPFAQYLGQLSIWLLVKPGYANRKVLHRNHHMRSHRSQACPEAASCLHHLLARLPKRGEGRGSRRLAR